MTEEREVHITVHIKLPNPYREDIGNVSVEITRNENDEPVRTIRRPILHGIEPQHGMRPQVSPHESVIPQYRPQVRGSGQTSVPLFAPKAKKPTPRPETLYSGIPPPVRPISAPRSPIQPRSRVVILKLNRNQSQELPLDSGSSERTYTAVALDTTTRAAHGSEPGPSIVRSNENAKRDSVEGEEIINGATGGSISGGNRSSSGSVESDHPAAQPARIASPQPLHRQDSQSSTAQPAPLENHDNNIATNTGDVPEQVEYEYELVEPDEAVRSREVSAEDSPDSIYITPPDVEPADDEFDIDSDDDREQVNMEFENEGDNAANQAEQMDDIAMAVEGSATSSDTSSVQEQDNSDLDNDAIDLTSQPPLEQAAPTSNSAKPAINEDRADPSGSQEESGSDVSSSEESESEIESESPSGRKAKSQQMTSTTQLAHHNEDENDTQEDESDSGSRKIVFEQNSVNLDDGSDADTDSGVNEEGSSEEIDAAVGTSSSSEYDSESESEPENSPLSPGITNTYTPRSVLPPVPKPRILIQAVESSSSDSPTSSDEESTSNSDSDHEDHTTGEKSNENEVHAGADESAQDPEASGADTRSSLDGLFVSRVDDDLAQESQDKLEASEEVAVSSAASSQQTEATVREQRRQAIPLGRRPQRQEVTRINAIPFSEAEDRMFKHWIIRKKSLESIQKLYTGKRDPTQIRDHFEYTTERLLLAVKSRSGKIRYGADRYYKPSDKSLSGPGRIPINEQAEFDRALTSLQSDVHTPKHVKMDFHPIELEMIFYWAQCNRGLDFCYQQYQGVRDRAQIKAQLEKSVSILKPEQKLPRTSWEDMKSELRSDFLKVLTVLKTQKKHGVKAGVP